MYLTTASDWLFLFYVWLGLWTLYTLCLEGRNTDRNRNYNFGFFQKPMTCVQKLTSWVQTLEMRLLRFWQCLYTLNPIEWRNVAGRLAIIIYNIQIILLSTIIIKHKYSLNHKPLCWIRAPYFFHEKFCKTVKMPHWQCEISERRCLYCINTIPNSKFVYLSA